MRDNDVADGAEYKNGGHEQLNGRIICSKIAYGVNRAIKTRPHHCCDGVSEERNYWA